MFLRKEDDIGQIFLLENKDIKNIRQYNTVVKT